MPSYSMHQLSTPNPKMVETTIITSSPPRISFSSDFLDDEKDFISISPHSHRIQDLHYNDKTRNADFEFLSTNTTNTNTNNIDDHSMITADQLFFQGKLLPFWQMQHSERLGKINLKSTEDEEDKEEVVVCSKDKDKEETRPGSVSGSGSGSVIMNTWFVDDDPSPRPPKCTVLWKELLRLKKQRNVSSLSPSSSSSSTSSSSSSLADAASMTMEEKKKKKSKEEGDKQAKRVKKGLERTRSGSIRIRPMINVPICTHMKTASSLPPLFPLNKLRHTNTH